MRILCCLDGTNSEQISQAVSTFMKSDTLAIRLLYVTDSGPQRDIGLRRERSFTPRLTGPLRHEQMRQSEQFAAQDILEEGKRYFSHVKGVEILQRAGRPEREIVNAAAAWNADIIVICPCATNRGAPPLGPKSVGHVARFVLDHAPCPVLLVRPLTGTSFPLPG